MRSSNLAGKSSHRYSQIAPFQQASNIRRALTIPLQDIFESFLPDNYTPSRRELVTQIKNLYHHYPLSNKSEVTDSILMRLNSFFQNSQHIPSSVKQDLAEAVIYLALGQTDEAILIEGTDPLLWAGVLNAFARDHRLPKDLLYLLQCQLESPLTDDFQANLAKIQRVALSMNNQAHSNGELYLPFASYSTNTGNTNPRLLHHTMVKLERTGELDSPWQLHHYDTNGTIGSRDKESRENRHEQLTYPIPLDQDLGHIIYSMLYHSCTKLYQSGDYIALQQSTNNTELAPLDLFKHLGLKADRLRDKGAGQTIDSCSIGASIFAIFGEPLFKAVPRLDDEAKIYSQQSESASVPDQHPSLHAYLGQAVQYPDQYLDQYPSHHHSTHHHPTQHHPVQYHSTQHHPVQYHPVQHHPTQHHPVQYHPTQHHPVQHGAQPIGRYPIQSPVMRGPAVGLALVVDLSKPFADCRSNRSRGGLVSSRSLIDTELGRLQKHVDSHFSLQKRTGYGDITRMLPVDRRALLSRFLQKMQKSHYQVHSCYLAGSSVNTVLSGEDKKSDLDFTVTTPNLPKNFTEGVRTSLIQLMCESIDELTSHNISMKEAAQFFSIANFEDQRSNSQVYVFSLGDDTDLIISSQLPNYALAHQARAIDVSPILQDSFSRTKGAYPKPAMSIQTTSMPITSMPTLVYMEDSHRVESAIGNKILLPNQDEFIHWSHIIPVAKSMAKGFTFYSQKVATQFYNSTLSAMHSSTSKFAADGVSFQVNKKLQKVKIEALLGLALDLPSRVSHVQSDAKKSIKLCCSLLLGALLDKQKSWGGTTNENKQMTELVGYLTSKKNENFIDAAKNLNDLLALNHLVTQPHQFVQANIEGKSNRFHINTWVVGLNLNVTFDCNQRLQQDAGLRTVNPQYDQGDNAAALLLANWNDDQISQVYELAQSLDFTVLADYISGFRIAISDRPSPTTVIAQNRSRQNPSYQSSSYQNSSYQNSSYQNMALLSDRLENITLSTPKTPKDSGLLRSSIQNNRFFIGNKCYELIQASQTTIGEKGLPKGDLTIKWHGREATLSDFQHKDNNKSNGGQAKLMVIIEQSGLSGSVRTHVNINQSGEIKIATSPADEMQLGPLTYTGELKGIYSYRGKLLRVQPVGENAKMTLNQKGKPAISLTGDFLSTGQLRVKSIDGKPIDADACYVKWDTLADIDKCWFDVKKTLDQASGLQLDAKHKLVSTKVMREDISSNPFSGKKKTAKSKKGKKKTPEKNHYVWKNELVAMQGKLSIKGKDQCLAYSRLSKLSDGVVVVSDKRENGVISYQIGQESSPAVVTSVALEVSNSMLLEANNLEFGSEKKSSYQDLNTLIIQTVVNHLNNENMQSCRFHQNEPSYSESKLHLIGKQFDVSYSGDRLQVTALRAALPFDMHSGISVKEALERASYLGDKHLYMELGEAEKKAYIKKKYRVKKGLSQALRSNSTPSLAPNKVKNLMFKGGDTQFTWPMDEIIGLAISPDSPREVTLPFKRKDDIFGYNYLLRYEGELGEKLQLGTNVSNITLLRHLPENAPTPDQKLHPPVYTANDAAGNVPFVQLKHYLSASSPAVTSRPVERPIVERLDITNNYLFASWTQRGEIMIKPLDATAQKEYIKDEEGKIKLITTFEDKHREYLEVLFKQKHKIDGHHSSESRSSNDLYSDSLSLETGMNISFVNFDSSIQATLNYSNTHCSIVGSLPANEEKKSLQVRAVKVLNTDIYDPFVLSTKYGDQVNYIQVYPYSKLVEGLEELKNFDSQQMALIELIETAMRGVIFYRIKIMDTIVEAKELINVDTSKIQLPKDLW